MKRLARDAQTLAAFALLSSAGAASACPGPRPTDEAGFEGFVYTSAFTSYATNKGRVRVWYATEGPDAPDSPEDAATIGDVIEDAIDGYLAMGYRAPPGDADDAGCAPGGGDGRLDVYLVDFAGAADGLTAPEDCTSGLAPKCSSFILVDNDFAGGGYPSFEDGAKTVAPHEYFHAVQNGYDADLDRWWAEGTAQWATKELHPELDDLERFLPAYFDETRRSLDAPPGGVTAAFLYATAIWPLFLGEHVGPEAIREGFEELGIHGGSAVDAVDRALRKHHATSFADEFATFATWNAATGSRAGRGGYANAKKYPEVTLTPLSAVVGSSVDGVNAGFGALYYANLGAEERELDVDTDSSRNVARALPVDGAALVARTADLPTVVSGDRVIVVAGQGALATDAPFTLAVRAPPATATSGGTGSGAGGSGGGTTDPDSTSDAGCTLARLDAPGSTTRATLAAVALFSLTRLRRRTRR